MRTTVSIDDELLARAKARAQRDGSSLGQIVEVALRRELNRSTDDSVSPAVPVFSGTGPRPGFDLSSSRALHEALDEGTELDRLR